MVTVQLTRWRGGRFTPEFAAALASADAEVPGFVLTQGGFNGDNNAVAASAGTHDGDAADFSVRGKTFAQVVAFIIALRKRGIAAWFRTTREGKWGVRPHGFTSYHIHCVPNGWGRPSRGAKHQAAEYRAGRDGLAGRGTDTGGPGHTAKYRTRTWAGYLASIAPKAAPKPKPPFPKGLRPGSSKPSAKPLQRQLKKAGFMPKSIKEADNYGLQTQKAVARFHNANPKLRGKGKRYDPAIGAKGWAHLFKAY